MPNKKTPNFRTGLNQTFASVPAALKPTQGLFTFKAIFMLLLALILAILIFFNPIPTTLTFTIPVIFLSFLIINGLIMIASGLLNSPANSQNTTLIPSLFLGAFSIIAGGLPIVLFNYNINLLSFEAFTTLFLLFGLCLDFLFTIISLNLISNSPDRQWWVIGSGLVAVFTIIGVIFIPSVNIIIWLLLYLIIEGIIYFCSPLYLIATPALSKKPTRRPAQKPAKKTTRRSKR